MIGKGGREYGVGIERSRWIDRYVCAALVHLSVDVLGINHPNVHGKERREGLAWILFVLGGWSWCISMYSVGKVFLF